MRLSLLFVGVLVALFVSCRDDEAVTGDQDTQLDGFDFETHTKDTTVADAVLVVYNGTSATVTNPFESDGVKVSVSKGDVVVTSTKTSEVNYVLSGITGNGSFRVYSDVAYGLILNGVGIANNDASAINLQSTKKANVKLVAGTVNKLVDGDQYLLSDEDQKGTFFSEGQLIFSGSGSLTISALYHHALVSDDHIIVNGGSITIDKTVSDGIHANSFVQINGGELSIQSSSDGIDCEKGFISITGGEISIASADDGITTSYDGTDLNIISDVQLTGGQIAIVTSGDKANGLSSNGNLFINNNPSVSLSMSGKGSKGIKTAGDLTISDEAALTIEVKGAAFYDTNSADISAPAGFKVGSNLKIEKGTINITATGTGGHGISVDGALTLDNGTVNVTASGTTFTSNGQSSEAKGIKVDGAVVVNNGKLTISASDDGIKSSASISVKGGEVTISKSTEGMEGPAITYSGGTVSIVSSDDGINSSNGSGGEAADGSLVTISGGTVSVSSTNGDALDSNGSANMTGGTLILQGPSSAPEVAVDINGTFTISGGTLIGSGPNAGNMIEGTASSSGQYEALIKINGNVTAGTMFAIQDNTGTTLVTYTPVRTAYYFIFSSPQLVNGATYKVVTGGSVSGGTTFGGLATGGTYSGGTQKGTFTINSKTTTVTM